MYDEEMKTRALELYEGRSATQVLELLKRELTRELTEKGAVKYTEADFPNERTIRRWKKDISKSSLGSVERPISDRADEHTLPTGQLLLSHFNQLSELAKEMLGGLGHIQSLGKNHFRCYGLEDQPEYNKKVLYREKLIEWLHLNMIAAKNKNSTLYNSLITHLKFECQDYETLYDYLENSPENYFKLFQKISLRKTFQGRCDICKDW